MTLPERLLVAFLPLGYFRLCYEVGLPGDFYLDRHSMELFDGSFQIYHPLGEVIPYEELGKPEKGCQKVKLRLKTQT